MISKNFCTICNSINLHKLKLNYKFVSSDIEIVKYKPSHTICKNCNTVQKIINKTPTLCGGKKDGREILLFSPDLLLACLQQTTIEKLFVSRL